MGQHIWQYISRFRNDIYLEDKLSIYAAEKGTGDITINTRSVSVFNDEIDSSTDTVSGDPVLRLGSGLQECLEIHANYQNATKSMQLAIFKTKTESGTANDGRFRFSVDDNAILEIDDGGIDFYSGFAGGISFNGTDVLTDDGSGTTTLKNIDSLDATTRTTISTGVLTDASTSAKGVAQFSSDNFAASSGTITIKSGGVDLTDEVTGLLPTTNAKHLMHYSMAGYATADGTNYEMPKQVNTNQAPFHHDVSIGASGTTATTVQSIVRSGGIVMPRDCVLKRWTGWTASSGSATTYLGLFKYTPTRDDSDDLSGVLLEEFSYTALGNASMEDFNETSFTETAIAAGDIIITAIKGASSATIFFSGTMEVEF